MKKQVWMNVEIKINEGEKKVNAREYTSSNGKEILTWRYENKTWSWCKTLSDLSLSFP